MATPHVHDGEGALQPSSSATLSSRLHCGSSHRLDLVDSEQDITHTPSSPASCETKQSQVLFAVQNLISALTCWLLVQLLSLQDALLAIGPIRWLISYALMPRCRSVLDSRVVAPATNTSTFQNIHYYVSEEAQKLLLHGSLYSLVGSSTQVSTTLPPVGRILLHTGARHTTGFQRAVAAAVANRLGASLLVADEALLRAVSRATLGCDALEPGNGGSGGVTGVLNTLLSFVLSGGRVACVWDVLTQVATSADAPGALVVLVPDVESTLCGSFERWSAFEGAMDACVARSGRPLVLLGGCSLLETAASSAGAVGSAAASSSGGGVAAAGEDDKGEIGGGNGGSGYSPPQDDSLSSLLPLAAELGLSLDERPDPRKVLSQMFPTRVRLAPPTDTAAAARHMEQLQMDAASSGVAANHAALAALAADRGIEVPPATAPIFTDHSLNSSDWAKVLAWAVGLESARGQAEQMAQQPQQPHDGGSAAADRVPNVPQPLLLLRRSVSDGQLASNASAAKLSPPYLPQAVEERLPGRSVEASTHGSAAQASVAASAAVDCTEPAVSETDRHRKLPCGAVAQPSEVSQAALLYGIQMLRRSGGSIRGNISIDNAYERRLIAEVIQPEAAGGGFKDVGALSAAKDALREAVQLPLQHPRLFCRGALARPCKGVLLFGPPGTGKTLLARAAAAECGAAFLAISPSTLASKWVGDGVRYVRALFTLAAKLSPCVIFIDEVDALLGKRNSHSEHEALREMKNELMAQWDGIRSATTAAAPRVMVLGATNRPGDLDDAVLRRFSRRLLCDLPDLAARKLILKVILDGEELAGDVSISAIASATDGFSGSDLRQLCVAAAMRPVRELLAASGRSKTAAASVVHSKAFTSAPAGAGAGAGADGIPAQQPPTAPDHVPTGTPVTQHQSQEKLQQLMVAEVVAEYETTAAAAAAAEVDSVRPLAAADFEAAQRDVAPSVAPDGSVMSELRGWDAQFGEGSKRRGWDSKLSYFT